MNIVSLASHLASARLRNRKGNGILDSFAVAAFAGSSFLELTTLGGVWMFVQRRTTIDVMMAANLGISPDFTIGTGETLAAFAYIALAILIVPIFSLGMAAARLGAQGRSRRLASLRLLGMTASEVRFLAIIETFVHFVVGFAIGFILYVATLPLWKFVSFGTVPIEISEMLIPWWLVMAAFVVLAAVAMVSTLVGLIKVSISPLGVSRRSVPKALGYWRVALFVVLIGVAVYVARAMSNGDIKLDSSVQTVMVYVFILLIIITGFSIFGPFVIQILGRLVLRTKNPARLIAARRLIDDPRSVWRSVTGVLLMAMIASYTVLLSRFPLLRHPEIKRINSDDPSVQVEMFSQMAEFDVAKGVLIALSFTLILAALSTLLQQASDVFDRAREERTLVLIGAPMKMFSLARIQQVLVPFTVLMIAAMTIAPLLAIMTTVYPPVPENRTLLVAIAGIGILVIAIPVLLTIPLERQVLAQQQRRND
ncbi:MAG: hypothetical protein PUK59_04395 [Actinomycetaceae bacterium]|nr:hypothetical protein [Actinomycetaceae bacterium]MDY5855245.1 FtsX-like permease family protein [Arcanobacterium sp.]